MQSLVVADPMCNIHIMNPKLRMGELRSIGNRRPKTIRKICSNSSKVIKIVKVRRFCAQLEPFYLDWFRISLLTEKIACIAISNRHKNTRIKWNCKLWKVRSLDLEWQRTMQTNTATKEKVQSGMPM
jgi:hypothetical protein